MHVQCTCRACRVDRAGLWLLLSVERARREASCSLLCPPARARRGYADTSCPGTVVGRKEPAAPLAQAAAGLHVAEPVCLACAFLNPACLQKRYVITGIRRPSFSCPRACAPRASASRAVPGSTFSSLRQCARAPVVRANILHLQDCRRSTNRIPHHTPAPACQRLCELLSARPQNALY